jgi:hypothetical protein
MKGAVGTAFDALAIWKDYAVDVRGHAVPRGHFLPEEAPHETLQAMLLEIAKDLPGGPTAELARALASGAKQADTAAANQVLAEFEACAAQAGIEDAGRAQHGGIAFRAPSEQAVGELSLALAEAGALTLTTGQRRPRPGGWRRPWRRSRQPARSRSRQRRSTRF